MDKKEELKKLVEKFKSNEKYYTEAKSRYNETDTRNEFIDPFFEILGWDIHNRNNVRPNLREVMRENYLTSTSRPDYAFTLSGVKKFFTEAKKPAVRILSDMESILQARRYGYNAKHLITVLTNFEYLLIYDATVEPKETDNPYTALLMQPIHYSKYEENFDEIEKLLSKETVYSGSFENNLEDLVNQGVHMPIDELFLQQIRQWRLLLANELYKSHPEYSLAIISDLIQKFINQMIFLRLCEDRNLPIYHNLQKTIEDPNEVQEKMLKMFEEADKKYNSGLFNGDHIIIDLNNQIIMDIVNKLYRPQSPYEFAVIEANLLGEIYEYFLTEKLYIKEDGTIGLTKKAENVNRDVVSTPTEIVRYMVNKTLAPTIEGKAPQEILKIKIADIACGSGVFLLEVLDYLIQYCTNWYQDHEPEHLIPGEDGIGHIPFEDKKEILTSCIYGIDIDANAVEAAKFSLLISLLDNETTPTLEGYNEILPMLDENIQAGNSLIQTDYLGKKKITDEDRNNIFPFDFEFANGVRDFDVIIGNPPYVTTDDMINILPKQEVAIYKNKYESSYKQFDKYFIFIERALEMLKEGGVLCYIVPSKFSKISSGVYLRKILTENSYVSEFIDFGSTQLFAHKKILTYSCILTAKKEQQEEFVFEEVTDLQEWWVNQQDLSKLKRVKYASHVISDAPWILVTNPNEKLLLEKLYENSVKLKDITEVLNGIQTSAEDVYPFGLKEIIGETKTNYEIQKNGKTYQIEKGIVRDYFKPVGKEKGKGTYDYELPRMYLIFPYDMDGEIIDKETLESEFPGTWEYLKDNYDRLLPKQLSPSKKGRDVKHATSDTWYHYGRSQHLTSFNNKDKLIVKVMKNEVPLYRMDKNDMLIASGGTAGYVAIAQKDGSPYELEYIQAVLSHPAYQILSSIIGSDFEGGFNATGTAVLYDMPVRTIDFENKVQVCFYNDIVEATRKIYQINDKLAKKLSNKERTALLRERRGLIREITDNVTKLYGIEELMRVLMKETKVM
ncbi:Eco57I restriction-modification methylase domain-containing protein [Bacillus pumilus]|uniref:Eco57I restriction-modification methylase domain-containing protein n=1 Tax=Bacillus pumilus TaxID=1408 RepID=UPI000D1FE8FD|nr:N-6 DNA methylase [Bacillus pumilus]AVI42278.1 restriction endonuclease subunit M [Bacillus pumilus]QHQ75209.1 N-6 DNA methylase [Bacillus pumilus]